MWLDILLLLLKKYIIVIKNWITFRQRNALERKKKSDALIHNIIHENTAVDFN